MQDEFIGRLVVAHHDRRDAARADQPAPGRDSDLGAMLRTLGVAAGATVAAFASVASVLIVTWTSAAVPIV